MKEENSEVKIEVKEENSEVKIEVKEEDQEMEISVKEENQEIKTEVKEKDDDKYPEQAHLTQNTTNQVQPVVSSRPSGLQVDLDESETQADLLRPTTPTHEADSLQSAPSPSPVPSPSSSFSTIRQRTLQDNSSFISPEGPGSSSPASGYKQRRASETAGPEPKRRKRLEDMVLRRSERIDEEREARKENEDVRFGYVVGDMSAEVPPHEKMELKFQIHKLVYNAMVSQNPQ